MNKVILWLVAIFLVGAVAIAEAQQPKKIPRIGYSRLAVLRLLIRTHAEAFRQGLRDLGYVEGQNIALSFDMPRERLTAFRACCRASATQG